MGGILSAPKPPAPDPSIAEAQRKQEERLAKQEERATKLEASRARSLSATDRARRVGGLRMLLSEDRENPQLGLSDKLGG
jgi:hypothetical protein